MDSSKKYTISRQLLKSGTSIGANAMEAQNAESKADFIHKIKIAAKEADESQYWLLLCSFSGKYPECNPLLVQLESVQKVLNKISGAAKKEKSSQLFNEFLYLLTTQRFADFVSD